MGETGLGHKSKYLYVTSFLGLLGSRPPLLRHSLMFAPQSESFSSYHGNALSTSPNGEFAKPWWARQDSNLHRITPTTTSTLRVYQFRHSPALQDRFYHLWCQRWDSVTDIRLLANSSTPPRRQSLLRHSHPDTPRCFIILPEGKLTNHGGRYRIRTCDLCNVTATL